MVASSFDFKQAEEFYKIRVDTLDSIKKDYINANAEYANYNLEDLRSKSKILSVFAIFISVISPFLSYFIVSIADIDCVIESPIYVILFIIAFLSISAYMALHIAKNKIIIERKRSVNEHIKIVDNLKNALTQNLNKTTYSANAVSMDIDDEISKLKVVNFYFEDNDILNGAYFKEIYWISSVSMMIATAILTVRIILCALIQESSGWLIFCIILYFVASGVGLWAFYHYLIEDKNFLYSTGSYIFNIFYQLLFTILLIALFPVLVIAVAIGIVILFFKVFG